MESNTGNRIENLGDRFVMAEHTSTNVVEGTSTSVLGDEPTEQVAPVIIAEHANKTEYATEKWRGDFNELRIT